MSDLQPQPAKEEKGEVSPFASVLFFRGPLHTPRLLSWTETHRILPHLISEMDGSRQAGHGKLDQPCSPTSALLLRGSMASSP